MRAKLSPENLDLRQDIEPGTFYTQSRFMRSYSLEL